MPSRINIGPEDGPYVAINESSGNLQLEDNSGNVVAEWDETNAQWDFANNTLNNVDALNSNSVNTEEASVNGPLDAETATVDESVVNSIINHTGLDGPGGDPLKYLGFAVQQGDFDFYLNDPVIIADNEAKTITDRDQHSIHFVIGDSVPTAGQAFIDLVGIARFAGLNSTEIAQRDPVSRSYGEDSSGLNIAIDENSDEYEMTIFSFGVFS